MKKFLFAILFFIFVFALAACASIGNVQSVTVDDTEYKTIYLYSFKDANITKKYNALNSSDSTPTSCGFIYSTEKLSVGDSITVWETYIFSKTNTNNNSYNDSSNSSVGTKAIIDKVVAIYRINVDATFDTYKITYYKFPSSFDLCVSNEDQICSLSEQNIEVVKDRVLIKYE